MSDAETRAAAAKRLMDDPLLREAFGNVRAAAIEAWGKSKVRDTEAREKAFFTVRALDLILDEFENIITNGKIAASRTQRPDPQSSRA
jgi:hypothetical protein